MANVSLNSISARIRAVFLAIKWISLSFKKIDYKAFITQNDNPTTFYVEPIFATYFAEWADKRKRSSEMNSFRAPPGARTLDPNIKSVVLYQLS